jgi:hypothetical protein
MRCNRLALCVLLLLIPISAVLAQVTPRFEDYPAGSKFAGKHHAPILTQESRQFRTHLSRGAKEKVNFAGHYVLTLWGCGTACQMGAAIDAKTGRVFLIPVGGLIEGHPDSRLLAIQEERSEGGFDTQYYQIDDEKGWVLLRGGKG